MHSAQCKTPNGQLTQNDLANTPEHLRPGFTGQVRQYDPTEFGLTNNEEWRNPRMFRNMTYETDAEAMDALRLAQPRRQMYRPPIGANLSNLTEECLADVSAPAFDLSMPSQMSGSGGEYLANISPPHMSDTDKAVGQNDASNYVDSVYRQVVHSFKNAHDHNEHGDNLLPAVENRTPVPNQVPEKGTVQQNNSVLTTLRKITTHRDQCGNVTSRVEETSTVSNTPYEQVTNLEYTPIGTGQGGQGRHLHFSMPTQSENIADISMPSFYDNSMPAMSTRIAPQGMTSERLADISAPAFADSMGRRMQATPPTISNILAPPIGKNVCLENISAPSFPNSTVNSSRSPGVEDICDMSAPPFASTNRFECLEDISMPSGVSGAIGDSKRQATEFPSECLYNVTMPSFGGITGTSGASRRQGNLTSNECLEDITMPSYGGVSAASNRQANYMPSERLNEVSAPSLVSSTLRSRTPRRQQRSMPSHNTFDITALEDISMPSYEGVSSATARTCQQRSMPSQTICDILAPSFETFGQAPNANDCLENVTMPTYDSTGQTAYQYLEDISMPSFGGVGLVGSRAGSPSRQQRSMPPQNICDISAPSQMTPGQMTNECLENVTMPSYEYSGRGPGNNVCLEDISMPSFGGVSAVSKASTLTRQQRSIPTQTVCDILAPSFENSGRGTTAHEYLEDVTMPSFGSSARGPMTNEFLEDVTMPSFGGVSGASRARTPTRQQRSMPTQNISGTPVPSHGSSRRGPTTNECLEDITMPSYGSSGREFTNEFLEDICTPSFGGVSGASRARTLARQQQSMPSQNIYDISAPSFGNSGRGPVTTECLEDVNMPSFAGVSGSSRRQQAMPSECLDDVSAPSFGQRMSRSRSARRQQRPLENISNASRATATNGYLEDITMPSFGEVSSASRAGTSSRQQRFMQTQNITSPPSFRRRVPNTNECLENISMPSYVILDASRARSPTRQQQSLPSQNIFDISAPSFGNSGRGPVTNECLEDITMPSFGGVSGSSRRQQTMRSECLDEISAPSFGRSVSLGRSPQRPQTLQRNIVDITAPSFASSGRGPQTNDCLQDISMPSFAGISGASRARTPTRKQQSMPSQNICDISAPSFGSSGRGPNTNGGFNNITGSGPSYNRYLEDISMPLFEGVSGASTARTPTRKQQSMPSQNICDISAPSFGSSGRGPVTNECLEDITMPSFGGVSGSSRRQQTMRSECLDEISAPSFGRSVSLGRSPQRPQTLQRNIVDITAPSFASSGRGPQTTDCLQDVSMPAFAGISGASRTRTPTRQQRSMPSKNICDISAPSFESSGRGPNTNVFESSARGPMTNEFLEDVSMPSFAEVSGASRARTPTRQQRSIPSQNTCDTSALAVFGSNGRGATTNKYAGRSLSQGASPRIQQLSAPIASSGRDPMPSECIENITMPSGVSGAGTSRRELTMSSECLDNVTPPSYGRSGISQNTPQLWNISPPVFDTSTTQPSNLRRPRSEPAYLSECLDDESPPSFGNSSRGMKSLYQMPLHGADVSNESMQNGTPLRQVHSFPCIPSQQNIGDISAPSMGSPAHEFYNSFQNSRTVPRPAADESYPSEMLGNVSAPSYASTMNRTQPNRLPNFSSAYENLGNITEPSMFANSSARAQMPSNRNNSRPLETLNDREKTNFAHSTGKRLEDVMDISEPSGLYRSGVHSQNADNMGIPSERGQDLSGMPVKKNVSNLSQQISISEQSVKRTVIQNTSDQLGNESEPSALNNSANGPATVEVENVTVKTSVTSVKRIYPNEDNRIEDGYDNRNRDENGYDGRNRDKNGYDARNRDENGYQNVPSYQGINDISMPPYESTGISSPGQSNRNNMYLSDISEPTYGPSYQSSQQSRDPNGTFHGFDSMDNYAPFDQLVNSMPQNQLSNSNALSDNVLATPEQVRGKNVQVNKMPNSQRSEQKTGQKNPCSCSASLYGKPSNNPNRNPPR
ncbi:uncharacterized protein LOC115767342 [Drosophila novamexicana]|uniref:uncharacterized protein LOC115767342 n=1 Tax=Drosophila novamexicana TaxID=47314 RepID=UPI0011E5B867|nr:uncharacterized protein LOC115767342 [Drosophila novamexicana]